jgi:hypothetical protein
MSVETVLATGASSGIGRELARCFAAEGCRMILLARKRQALEALAKELRGAWKTHSEVLPADLAEPAAGPHFRAFRGPGAQNSETVQCGQLRMSFRGA